MGIGGSKENNTSITNTYVYKYSQINGEYMNEDIDTYDEEQYLIGEDLKQETTYRNKIRWAGSFNYESLQNNKYPIPNDVIDVEGVDLPTDPEIVELNLLEDESNEKINDSENSIINENGINTQNIEELPEITVYPISVNEINLDFSSVSDKTNFTYYINDTEIETVDLTEKTYTFEYNFTDTLEIVLTNEVYEEIIKIDPLDIRSEISLVGDNYAYLIGNNLYINGELQSGEYVNVYEGYALNTSGQTINMSSGDIEKNVTEKTNLEETAKPLHTYAYEENNIDVYGVYSKINGNVKLQIYDVRNGKLSALSNNTEMKIDNSITDNYNDKEYQTILKNSGEIVDLKEKLQYPDNFLNRNVKQIMQNADVEKTEVMIMYETGKVLVFNYVNGNIIYETQEKADEGLADYITGSVSNIWNDYESKQEEYVKSQELIEKLKEMPLEEILNKKDTTIMENDHNKINWINSSQETNDILYTNSNYSDNSYITVYNEKTKEYEVYSEEEILEGEEENPVSETEKIKANGLESVYNYEQEEETGAKVNGAIIVISIIGIAIISLIILRKIIYKNNQKNNK